MTSSYSSQRFKKKNQGSRRAAFSPLLFGIVIDWVFKTSMTKSAGISWFDGKTLSDLDFADDIALLHDSWDGMQTITSSLKNEDKKVGLVIYVAKTKIMSMGNWVLSAKIHVGTEKLEECVEFCYPGSTINNDGGCNREKISHLNCTN